MDAAPMPPMPSTSSICTPSAEKSSTMSSKPSESKLTVPSFRANSNGPQLGPFALIAVVLLLFCWDRSVLSLVHAQSELAPSLPPAHLASLPSAVPVALMGPSADSPITAFVPSGEHLDFSMANNWNNFPYGRTNRQQQTAASVVQQQNAANGGQAAQSVPQMNPLTLWQSHQQTMQAKQQQQQQQRQWHSQSKSQSAVKGIHNNVGWPNAFSVVANPQQNGAEFTKKRVPSSPFEGVPSFRSQYQQNRQKFAGGLSRLAISSEEEQQSAEFEQSQSRRKSAQQMPQAMITPDSNNPSSNNLDRYMPLLARHRPTPKNMTTHWSLANSAEIVPSAEERLGQVGGVGSEREEGAAEEEDGQDEAGSGVQQLGSGPCVSANCRTWITITIPSELVGLGGAESVGEAQQKERPPAHKAIVTQGQITKPSTNGWTKPYPAKANVSVPMQPIQPPKSRGMPTVRGGTAPKNGPTMTTSSPQTNLAVTTRQAPPDFVFSTKWILPVNGISIRPNATFASSPAPAGGNPWSISTSTMAASTTPWVQPFTIPPRPKVSPSTQPAAIPRERPSDKMRPPKPWTHTGGRPKASNVPKSRPEQPQQPNPMQPTTDSTIEQAAIWVSEWMSRINSGSDQSAIGSDGDGPSSKASTELIDAIRDALAKFRAALSRQSARSRQQQHDGTAGPAEDAAAVEQQSPDEWHAQLQNAWDGIKGTWLEKAVAELAMDAASSGRAEEKISDAKIAQMLQKAAALMDSTELGRIKGTADK